MNNTHTTTQKKPNSGFHNTKKHPMNENTAFKESSVR